MVDDDAALPRNTPVIEDKKNNGFGKPRVLFHQKRLFAKKRNRFLQLDDPSQSTCQGIDFRTDFMPVEREPRLQPEAVPRTETGQLEAMGLARFENPVGHAGRFSRGDENLHAILPGVAGPADDDTGLKEGFLLKMKTLQPGCVESAGFPENIERLGSLEGQQSKLFRNVIHKALEADGLFLNPFNILCGIGRIDAKQILLVPYTVDDKIVNNPAILVAHDGVKGGSLGESFDIIGHEVIEEGTGLPAMDANLSHVADIKEAGRFTDRAMLLHDGAVLHRHFPSGEGHHAGTVVRMKGMKGRTLQRICHAAEHEPVDGKFQSPKRGHGILDITGFLTNVTRMRNVIVLFCNLFLAGMVQAGPFIVAHRGASAEAPENTLPAFERAWEQGADAIEGDFFLTADNQIVCLHDRDTERVAGQKLEVADSSLRELQALDVGQWKELAWKGTGIPTLAQVLDTVPEGKKVFIEIKCGPEMLPFLQSVLEKSGLADEQIVIISFNKEVVTAARKRFPSIKANWLSGFRFEDGVLEPGLADVLDTLKETGATGFGAQAHERIHDAFVEAILMAGFEYHVWTVNEPHVAHRFARMGAHSVTTDVPGLMKRAFAD